MNELTHPLLIHFPLALTFILPFIVIYTIYLEKFKEQDKNQIWYFTIFIMFVISLFSLLSVFTGEMGEEILEKFIPEKHIENHEELGELFAIVNYILMAISIIVLFIPKKVRIFVMIAFLILNLTSVILAIKVGSSGGSLIYEHNAANYLIKNKKDLPPQSSKQIKESDDDDIDE